MAGAGAFMSFMWLDTTLIKNAFGFEVAFQLGVTEYLEYFKEEVKSYAQDNAPWEDQTGDARAGLDTSLESKPYHWNLWLFHTVDYGIWLEIRWNGRYAIIMPTLEAKGGEALSGVTMSGLLIHGL